MKEVTGALLDFAQNTRYEDIPDEVIHGRPSCGFFYVSIPPAAASR